MPWRGVSIQDEKFIIIIIIIIMNNKLYSAINTRVFQGCLQKRRENIKWRYNTRSRKKQKGHC